MFDAPGDSPVQNTMSIFSHDDLAAGDMTKQEQDQSCG